MEINQKSGIYKIEGEFTQNNSNAQENSFSGYVKLEDDLYIYKDRRLGDVKIVFFKGIQVDNYDEDKKSRLVFGGLQETKDFLSMYFRKVVNDIMCEPLVYGVESQNGKIEGSYEGEWGSVFSINLISEPARITEFRELSDAEVVALKVKEFLKKGYEETKVLPPQMQAVVEKEEETNDVIRKVATKVPVSQFGE